MGSYNSSHVQLHEIAAFKGMIRQFFPLDALTTQQRLALAAALEESAVEIRQACAINEAAKNQIA